MYAVSDISDEEWSRMIHVTLTKDATAESDSSHMFQRDVIKPLPSSIDWEQRGMVSPVRNQVHSITSPTCIKSAIPLLVLCDLLSHPSGVGPLRQLLELWYCGIDRKRFRHCHWKTYPPLCARCDLVHV